MSGIKSWSEEDRPREKLITKGASALSSAELLAILIGIGNSDQSAVELARNMLLEHDDNLADFASVDLSGLTRHRGIGPAKAVSILAALELSRRIRSTSRSPRPKIRSAAEAYEHLYQHLQGLTYEEFWIILLNRNSQVLSTHRISEGGVSFTAVDSKRIFKPAILANATSVVMAHNHPSGNLRPSRADIDLTKKLIKAGQAVDVQVSDHIIFTEDGYTSLRDEGYFQ